VSVDGLEWWVLKHEAGYTQLLSAEPMGTAYCNIASGSYAGSGLQSWLADMWAAYIGSQLKAAAVTSDIEIANPYTLHFSSVANGDLDVFVPPSTFDIGANYFGVNTSNLVTRNTENDFFLRDVINGVGTYASPIFQPYFYNMLGNFAKDVRPMIWVRSAAS
jgi:hypothetical protein